jgi:hypothetical protein
MAIRVTINGVSYEADTAAEVIELQELLTQPVRRRRQVVPVGEISSLEHHHEKNGDGEVGGDNYRTFVGSLNNHGMSVISSLYQAYPNGLYTQDLAKSVGLQPASLPPIFKHLRSAAAKSGLNPDEIVMRRQIVLNNRVLSEYQLAEDTAANLKGKV